jgi:hypothetical protein
MRRVLACLAAILAVAVAAGCGLGAGEKTTGASVTVTQDFGREVIGRRDESDIPAGDTVMRFLQRSFDVETTQGGTFVQGIDGIRGGREQGRPVDWFYYVNGIEAGDGAAAHKVADGDRVWWDRHDWGGAMRVPAVVGSFPAPFNTNVDGRRLPIRLNCGPSAAAVCDEVEKRLSAVGLSRFARAGIGASVAEEILRIVIGPWDEIRRDPTVSRLEDDVETSGVFARFEQDGRRLALLDARGDTVRRLGAGAGLVAATRLGEQQPTWVVTGTDVAGATAAASVLAQEALGNRFAVAVERGRPIPLPARPGGTP